MGILNFALKIIVFIIMPVYLKLKILLQEKITIFVFGVNLMNVLIAKLMIV